MTAKYGTRSLLAVTAAIALLCALSVWIFNPPSPNQLSDLPPLFVPSIPMMLVGILLIPIFCLPATLVASVMVFGTRRFPFTYTAFTFFGLQPIVLFADISFWDTGMRFAISVIGASVLMFSESVFRKLDKIHYIASGIAIMISLGWYVGIVCGVISAGV